MQAYRALTNERVASLSSGGNLVGVNLRFVARVAGSSPGGVCGDQMALYNEVLPEFRKVGAVLLGVSVDGSWCRRAFAESRQVQIASADHSDGPENAPVVLLEYGDYLCPACGEAYPVVKQIQKHFSARLRFVFRNFPLKESHHDASFDFATLSTALEQQSSPLPRRRSR